MKLAYHFSFANWKLRSRHMIYGPNFGFMKFFSLSNAFSLFVESQLNFLNNWEFIRPYFKQFPFQNSFACVCMLIFSCFTFLIKRVLNLNRECLFSALESLEFSSRKNPISVFWVARTVAALELISHHAIPEMALIPADAKWMNK